LRAGSFVNQIIHAYDALQDGALRAYGAVVGIDDLIRIEPDTMALPGYNRRKSTRFVLPRLLLLQLLCPR
jgi:hypothetical protein